MPRSRNPIVAAISARRVGATFVLCLLALAGAGASAAAAGDTEEATIQRGLELRRHGQDEQALLEFNNAYASSKSSRALAQVGLAEQALGRWADAELHLERALEADADPWIRKNRGTLRVSLSVVAKHIGSLEVLGNPAGAEVRVQGNSVGRLPLEKPTRVPAGDVVVEVRHPGYHSISRTVGVAAGSLSRETIVLLPLEETGGGGGIGAVPSRALLWWPRGRRGSRRRWSMR